LGALVENSLRTNSNVELSRGGCGPINRGHSGHTRVVLDGVEFPTVAKKYHNVSRRINRKSSGKRHWFAEYPNGMMANWAVRTAYL
jgi:hypothetical protein